MNFRFPESFNWNDAFWVSVAVGGLWVWMLPGWIAGLKRSPRTAGIGVLGIVGALAWGLGWLAALIWALCEPDKREGRRSFGEWLSLLFPIVWAAVMAALAWKVFGHPAAR